MTPDNKLEDIQLIKFTDNSPAGKKPLLQANPSYQSENTLLYQQPLHVELRQPTLSNHYASETMSSKQNLGSKNHDTDDKFLPPLP